MGNWIKAIAAASLVAASVVGVNSGTNVRALPDRKLTPGQSDPRVTQGNIQKTICIPGYTSTVRPSSSIAAVIKRNRMRAYGYTTAANFELDHLIALELGGDPASILNLWPEPWEAKGGKLAKRGYGAESKDAVENRLHKKVCNGTTSLSKAQLEISSNWQQAKG